ncbi:MAG: alpha-glucan family phosphorylase [Planctomycetota bacterium]
MSDPSFLYVVSWEICNREGGVYTALSGAAPSLGAHHGEDLLFIGPDLRSVRGGPDDFLEAPVQPEWARLAAEHDVPVRFGRWAVDGSPPCVLVHFGRLLEQRNGILGDLWNEYGVDSLSADWDVLERLLFGHAAGKLIELHYHLVSRPRGRRAAAHFHQWPTGTGLLHVANSVPEIGTVYTPHGTALGRALADAGAHNGLESIDVAGSAREHGAAAQHSVELAVAKKAAVLTTVSEQVSEETLHLLGRRPDLITPNGYRATGPLDPERRTEVRSAVLDVAQRFVGSPIAADTRLVLCSGRYEFRNKGIDLLLGALGRLQEGDRPQRDLLLLLLVPAKQTGPRPLVVRRLRDDAPPEGPCGVCTHNLAHPEDDLIVEACKQANIENAPGSPVRVIFCPILLEGRDPLFPYGYQDVLRAFDLTVFPSLYEPWGYTPLESLAAGVPTVTTDRTGFGRFVQSLPDQDRRAVTLLETGEDRGAMEERLELVLREFLARGDEELDSLRASGSAIAESTSWDRLSKHTRRAHALALEKTAGRSHSATPLGWSRVSRRSIVSLPARTGRGPQLHRFTVVSAAPERLARLHELAHNLWWSWNPDAGELFERLDPAAFEQSGHNPVRFLAELDPTVLNDAASDAEYVASYDAVIARFEAYRTRAFASAPRTAYFCAEFALHESLPIYSGGLGVLAGDHLKSASDLALPYCAVGLRYADGYFRQRIEKDGSQGVVFERIDPGETPLVEVTDSDNNPLRITLPMPERDLTAGVWRVDVGRVPLYLLDTVVEENDPADRGITERLYPSAREPRLRQEMLLGMGGWRLMRELQIPVEVVHINEGHSAFLLLERLCEFVENEGLTFAEAVEVVRAGTVFTTHTPVPAGHDRFAEDLMRRYFGRLAPRLGLDWLEFMALGRTELDQGDFSMTNLALHLSGRANGVSKLHGEVAREMHNEVWPAFHIAETPIDSVTNGVHLPTWVGPEMRAVLESHLGEDWPSGDWAKAEAIPNEEILTARGAQRQRFLADLREQVERVSVRRGEGAAMLRTRLTGITDDALWIGYGRRFAPYKRATLLFRDEDRLTRLLADEKRPVRFVFAGKSHPDDREGAELVKRIVELSADERFAGRIFFVENYDVGVARKLVQGVDVWLNTPTRPLEASGTSGMKTCLNGAPHLSVLDGWWCEAYDGTNGWAIGDAEETDDPELQNERDSRALYGLLESSLVPEFFAEEQPGAGEAWLARVRRTLATVPAFFNTNRMVGDYVSQCYIPAQESYRRLVENEFAGAKTRAARHSRWHAAWPNVQIAEVSVTDLDAAGIPLGEHFEVRARVQLGTLEPDEVAVELYVGPAGPTGELREPSVVPLLLNERDGDGIALYAGGYRPKSAGPHRYGIRVRPAAETPQEVAALGFVRWA